MTEEEDCCENCVNKESRDNWKDSDGFIECMTCVEHVNGFTFYNNFESKNKKDNEFKIKCEQIREHNSRKGEMLP
jgi:hypothetical protein